MYPFETPWMGEASAVATTLPASETSTSISGNAALVASTERSLEPVTITASLATNVFPDLSASPWPRYGTARAIGNAAETERCPQMSNGLS